MKNCTAMEIFNLKFCLAFTIFPKTKQRRNMELTHQATRARTGLGLGLGQGYAGEFNRNRKV